MLTVLILNKMRLSFTSEDEIPVRHQSTLCEKYFLMALLIVRDILKHNI